jgi:hypothetical protein
MLGLVLLMSILALGFLISCGEEEKAELVPSSYEDWRTTTEEELDYPIPGHMNNYREIYINSAGLDYTVEEREGRTHYFFPTGTVIIKEIYDGFDPSEGEPPVQLTVMVKKPEDPRSRGGWLWVMENVETGEEQVIDGEFCITCHSNANERHPYGDGNPDEEFRDFVFFLPTRKNARE